MEFLNWLTEQESKILFASFWNDGTVIVYINNKKYVYVTDAIYHNKWKKMASKAPFKVLNQIKNQIKNGKAFQMEDNNLATKTKLS